MNSSVACKTEGSLEQINALTPCEQCSILKRTFCIIACQEVGEMLRQAEKGMPDKRDAPAPKLKKEKEKTTGHRKRP